MNEIRLPESGVRLRSNSVHLDNRELLSVTGVRDVGSFNERSVELLTDSGAMTVEGTGLHITKLDLEEGQVLVEGEVGAIVYEDDLPERKGSIFSRIFR